MSAAFMLSKLALLPVLCNKANLDNNGSWIATLLLKPLLLPVMCNMSFLGNSRRKVSHPTIPDQLTGVCDGGGLNISADPAEGLARLAIEDLYAAAPSIDDVDALLAQDEALGDGLGPLSQRGVRRLSSAACRL
ncbi:MAG: hypothetical protein KAI47_03925 [Deltaproteobacteria bacterium]|nr:hypothetical protein [Deltaproteobacteria bacterium]